jgi:hypothetical protein
MPLPGKTRPQGPSEAFAGCHSFHAMENRHQREDQEAGPASSLWKNPAWERGWESFQRARRTAEEGRGLQMRCREAFRNKARLPQGIHPPCPRHSRAANDCTIRIRCQDRFFNWPPSARMSVLLPRSVASVVGFGTFGNSLILCRDLHTEPPQPRTPCH